MSTVGAPRRTTPVKRLLLGRPLASEEAHHQLLPKKLALPVFASDALSSNAYATEEILHVLILAGVGALTLSIPIAGAVAVLLTIVIVSYRQTVRAYPRGGGSYIVSKDNLGTNAGLIAGAALMTDYVLTVAVSVAAGAFAITSLAPGLTEHRVAIALAAILLVTLLNLRGLKESGTFFAIPTYGFVLSVSGMLVVGLARCTVGGCPQIDAAHTPEEAVGPLTLFIVLRAFSSGATALTGVEAIADGVAAFRGRRPIDQARNAATTLAMLGAMSITMFLGITILANRMHAVPSGERSVLAQIAHATFDGGAGFVIMQIATAAILILAANTAYQDFPRLASILAKDRFLPRQFINRGDRLVFSNGVIVLAALAGGLIVIFDADVSRLIQLYVVGVFTSFTLSQAGMVARWRRIRTEGWRRRAIINTIGASTTGVVLMVVAITKFPHGAWIVIAAVPLIVLWFKSVNRHYRSVGAQLRVRAERPSPVTETHAILLVEQIDDATMHAVGYTRALRPTSITAVRVGESDAGVIRAWDARVRSVPLRAVPGDLRRPADAIRGLVRSLERAPGSIVTVVVPERLASSRWRHLVSRRRTQLLKAALLFERDVVVCDVPIQDGEPAITGGVVIPQRTVAVVLVSGVHNATLRAVEYARAVSATEVRAVTFNVDPEETGRLLEDWATWSIDLPLEAVDAPYRDVVRSLVPYLRRLREGAANTVVSVILPEFIVGRWWHQALHNQTALSIKAALLFEPGVVVSSVPFRLR